MKKENIYKFCWFICVWLIVGFFVRMGVDYVKYDSVKNSAPFYVFVIERMVEFVVPCIILFVVGIIAKKKFKGRD